MAAFFKRLCYFLSINQAIKISLYNTLQTNFIYLVIILQSVITTLKTSVMHDSKRNKKFELMLTRRAKAYSSSGLVV